ncbi:MAG: N-acetylneuraminate synthase family protein [Dehalococcoidales bacterium]|nr:N-acetylneuraminate synthase family protein [Dehalococcoidales bacterium]
MSRELIIDGRRISDDTDCYIIAELGHNHQGKLETARDMLHAAKECGADAIKFQKRENRALYTRALYNQPYDHENSFGKTYGEHREALEFGLEEYRELQRYAREIGITLFATAFDFQSADFLRELDIPAYKIASGDLKNIPLIEYVASFQKPVLISTGGGNIDDVQRAHDAAMAINPQLCLMQCTATYPSAYDELNLNTIVTYRERFPDTVVGLSAHDSGIAMVLVAYVLGARVIEKHFTLNRAMKGTDHAFSLERPGLTRVVRDLRRTRIALGDGIKRPYPSETGSLYKMGKKLVAARDLSAGYTLTREDIAIKSPNDGLPPYELENIIGKVTLTALTEDESISFEKLADNGQNK